MKNLIVIAHPNKKSFNFGILEHIKKACAEKSVEVVVRDLYDLHFDPILKPTDFDLMKRGSISVDVKTEQEHVAWADFITVIHPIWWAGFPAVLKGYIDRVMSAGFAYKYENGAPKGLLTGKKALIFSTTGADSGHYGDIGMHTAIKKVTDEGIFAFCGIEVAEHVFFGNIPASTDEERKGYLQTVKNVCVKYL